MCEKLLAAWLLEWEWVIEDGGNTSAVGYGAALMDESGNVVAMMSRRNKKPWAHSSDAELDALLQALRTFRHLTVGRQIVVFTYSWASDQDVELEGPEYANAKKNGRGPERLPLSEISSGIGNPIGRPSLAPEILNV